MIGLFVLILIGGFRMEDNGDVGVVVDKLEMNIELIMILIGVVMENWFKKN